MRRSEGRIGRVVLGEAPLLVERRLGLVVVLIPRAIHMLRTLVPEISVHVVLSLEGDRAGVGGVRKGRAIVALVRMVVGVLVADEGTVMSIAGADGKGERVV